MSKGKLPIDLFPVMLYPVERKSMDKPPPTLLLFVVLAWISLLCEPVTRVSTKIPPSLSLAMLLTTVLLLLSLRTIESLTSLRTRSLPSVVCTRMPVEVAPGSRTTFPWSFHSPPGAKISMPKLKALLQAAVTVTNFTNEPAEFSARKPLLKLLIVPSPRTRTCDSIGAGVGKPTRIPTPLMLHIAGTALPLIVCPFKCNRTPLATMSMPSTPGRHGPTSVRRLYSPGSAIRTGHVLWVMVVPDFAGEAQSRMMEIAATVKLGLAIRMLANTFQFMVNSFLLWLRVIM